MNLEVILKDLKNQIYVYDDFLKYQKGYKAIHVTCQKFVRATQLMFLNETIPFTNSLANSVYLKHFLVAFFLLNQTGNAAFYIFSFMVTLLFLILCSIYFP